MSRPSSDHVRRLRPLDSRSQIPRLVGKFLSEMLSNLSSGSNPHAFLRRDILDDLLESSETAGLANAAAMQRNRHHLGRAITAFIIESIESVLNMVVEVSWAPETGGDVEFVVVTICAC